MFVGGPNPALRDDQAYSQAHFESVCAGFGEPSVLGRYETVFVVGMDKEPACLDMTRQIGRPTLGKRRWREYTRLCPTCIMIGISSSQHFA